MLADIRGGGGVHDWRSVGWANFLGKFNFHPVAFSWTYFRGSAENCHRDV